jgi:hypothetical protein
VRIAAITLAALAVAGCHNGDTVLRILVEPAGGPAPSSLRVTLAGLSAQPRTIAPVTLPGTLVIHRLPAGVSSLCVAVDGLDDGGNVVVGGQTIVHLTSGGTTQATVALDEAASDCSGALGDLGDVADLAGTPPADMAVAICPATAIFCDDFETGDFSKWTAHSAKQDAGSTTVQSTIKAHGTYAFKALANGASGTQVYAQAQKSFPPTAPPFALRANVYFPVELGHFNQLIALYEDALGSTNSFSIGGDNNDNIWEVSENESLAPDRFSDMVPTGAGQWHCVELVIDAAGMVDFYVDGHHLIGPWARASQVSYSMLLVGITRSVSTDLVAYIDDVAIGPSRLYCPP